MKRNPNIAFQKLGDEIVILDSSNNNQVHQLNPVASFLWENLDGDITKEDLVKLLTEEFEVSLEIAQSDFQNFLDELVDKSLVIL